MAHPFLYSEKLLDAYVAVFANATFLTYAYFTFLTFPTNTGLLFRGYNDLIAGILGQKWLMISVPFALYGIIRYVQIIYSVKEGTLEKIVTTDTALIVDMVMWIMVVLFVIYGIGG